MKELPWDYNFEGDNMIDLSKKDEKNGFTITVSEFFSKKEEDHIKKNTLNKPDKQIMAMNDGKFILEVISDDGCTADYYESNNINDLY
tara:strand:+ start:10964 stop:11227 length:264 start_codon:yes stop_codon:yes gene_type:complete